MNAREEVLARIRVALGGAPRPDIDIPRRYREHGATPPGDPALLDLLADRLLDYRAGVRRTSRDQLPAVIAEALHAGLARRDAGPPSHPPRIVVPAGLPDEWRTELHADLVIDEGLSPTALDDCDGVVTAASLAIAETGTVVLDGSSDQGRRAITLVPDVHVCVVHAHQIVAAVPDAMGQLDPTRPLTWISGPSATSDIELDRVEGVHGPRTLEVVLVEP